MGILEILLMILGISIFIISFRLPAKKEEQIQETKELAKEEIKELVNQEMEGVKSQIEEAVDETITYAVEKAERFMERISNEKIMAVNEYSDTVMNDIHKNHTEVLFLYDMLNEKHENIKNTVMKVQQAVKEIENMTTDGDNQSEADKSMPETGNGKEPGAALESGRTQLNTPVVDISFSGEDGRNSNEVILKLHKEGKSKIAIAKELGLGVGEVKLVIDLFEGI